MSEFIATDLEKFGERLLEIRKRFNLKQNELAKLLDITPAQVSSYETGRTKPTLELIYKLQLLFELQYEDLLVNDNLVTLIYAKAFLKNQSINFYFHKFINGNFAKVDLTGKVGIIPWRFPLEETYNYILLKEYKNQTTFSDKLTEIAEYFGDHETHLLSSDSLFLHKDDVPFIEGLPLSISLLKTLNISSGINSPASMPGSYRNLIFFELPNRKHLQIHIGAQADGYKLLCHYNSAATQILKVFEQKSSNELYELQLDMLLGDYITKKEERDKLVHKAAKFNKLFRLNN